MYAVGPSAFTVHRLLVGLQGLLPRSGRKKGPKGQYLIVPSASLTLGLVTAGAEANTLDA